MAIHVGRALWVQGLGACLKEADSDAVRRFLEEFAVRALLPNLESRLGALNSQVSSLTDMTTLC